MPRRKIEKVVTDRVIGYTVLSANGFTRVCPLYHVELYVDIPHQKNGKKETVTHILSSYQTGDYLNLDYAEDSEGYSLAKIAAEAVRGLEDRAWRRAAAVQRKAAKTKKSK